MTIDNRNRRRRLTVFTVLLALLLVTGVATPAAAKHKEKDAEPAEIVVKLEDGVDIDELNRAYGTTVVDALVPSKGLYVLGLTDDVTIDGKKSKKKPKDIAKKLAKEFEKDDRVDFAEVDAGAEYAENDWFHAWPSGFSRSVGEDPTSWTEQESLAYLQLERVHTVATGDGIVVAVLDTGADLNHPHLIDGLGDAGYDYIDDDGDPFDVGNGLDDDGDGKIDESVGHGTHTAGLVRLVAPDAEILVFRVLDSDGNGNPYVVAQAINDAVAAGADVINVSFGAEGKTKSKVLKDALKDAAKADVVVVAAAGNEGEDDEQFPALEKDVIGVTAVGLDNTELADFSNHGKSAMLAAPGVDIVSTAPGGGFAEWSGTSMATPLVAGQVALVMDHDPDRKLKHVIDKVGKSSRKLKGKRKVEKGLIDIEESLDR